MITAFELPDYDVVRRIGEGGMALVYAAVQKSLQREVALKVMNPIFSDDSAFTSRFVHEGRLLASLNHPQIITIHDIGVAGSWHYIAMELLTGGDLRSRIREGTNVDTTITTTQSIARALQHAHQNGIVHRDVKPSNILYRDDGTLALSDFGIAKQLGAQQGLTMAGSMVGSPHYLSPEQAQGKMVDARADIYSLGVLLYEMLTSVRPYQGDSDIDTILKHLTEPLPRLPDELSHFQPVLDGMLAKAADDRFPELGPVITELEKLRSETRSVGVLAAPLVRRENPSRLARWRVAFGRRRAILTIATALIIGTGTSLVLLPETEERESLVVTERLNKKPRVAVVTKPPALPPVAARALPTSEPVLNDTATQAISDSLTIDKKKKTQAPWAEVIDASLYETERLRHDALLADAQKATAEFRLTSPPKNNALYFLERALEIDPQSKAARAAFGEIASRYAMLARSHYAKGNTGQAKLYVERGLGVVPEHQALLMLRSEYSEAEHLNAVNSAGQSGDTHRADTANDTNSNTVMGRLKGIFRQLQEAPDRTAEPTQWPDSTSGADGV
jgi:serine/threonine-protein kinase PpkA